MTEIIFYKPLWLSETGQRNNNQDSIFPKRKTEKSMFFAVCDGVGGQPTGEIASDLACKSISKFYKKNKNRQIDNDFFEDLYKFSKNNFVKFTEKHPESSGMATTLTLLTFHTGGYTATWSGDSKIYQIRNGKILFSSKEHKMETGELYSVLNENEDNVIGLHNSCDIQQNDFFIQCTDGILEGITEKDLENYCTEEANPESILNSIKQECSKKSHDNFSMYLLKVKEVKQNIPFSSLHKNKNTKNILITLLSVFFVAFATLYFIAANTKKQNKIQENKNIQQNEFEKNGDKSVNYKNYKVAIRYYNKAIKDIKDDSITVNNIKIKISLLNEISNLNDTIRFKDTEIHKLNSTITNINRITDKKIKLENNKISKSKNDSIKQDTTKSE